MEEEDVGTGGGRRLFLDLYAQNEDGVQRIYTRMHSNLTIINGYINIKQTGLIGRSKLPPFTCDFTFVLRGHS